MYDNWQTYKVNKMIGWYRKTPVNALKEEDHRFAFSPPQLSFDMKGFQDMLDEKLMISKKMIEKKMEDILLLHSAFHEKWEKKLWKIAITFTIVNVFIQFL